MKFSFNFKNESLASKFQEALKERNAESIESTVSEDGTISVSYAISNCEEVKSSCDEEDVDKKIYSALSEFAEYFMREMQWQVNWLTSEIDYLYSMMYEHKQGHLPKVNSPSQMEAALKVLGLDGDYDVMKKVVYAKNGMKINQLS